MSSLGRVSWAHSAQGDIQPDGLTLGAELSISGSGEEMSTRTKVVADGAERSQETLRVLGGFEPLKYPLAFAGRQVRVLRPVVQTLVSPMLGVRQHPANRGWVASQLVGDNHAWFKADTINDLPKEVFGRQLITSRLNQDIQHDAVLIDRPPEPVAFAADLQQHLVEVPLVARPCSSPT